MRFSLLLVFVFFISSAIGQSNNDWRYEPSSTFPYGKVNPEAPQQIRDFESMIGLSECTSSNRNQEGMWKAPVQMQWKFKYIMNGLAVQDETLKSDGVYSGSIRQYNADSARWYVHYYSSATANSKLSTWEGNLKEGEIILTMNQAAPNGMEGYSRLTFYDITEQTFNWIGEWVSKDGSIVYPFWKIECKKVD